MLLVESLKRLYAEKKIDEATLNQLVEKGTIKKEDKEYIMGKEE